MASNVGLRVDHFTIDELLTRLLLLIWEDNVASECLSHQKIFTQSTGTSTQNFIWVCWDDSTKSKDEVMNHLHVEKVSGYRI